MEQTYKVFFNDRVLYVGGHFMPNTPPCTVWQKYTNRTELQQFIIEFRDNSQLHQALVYGANPDVIMQELSGFFRVIEAAGGVVKSGDQNLLFIHRLGVWDLPKGKMETGETPEQAAAREVEEECGIPLPVVDGFICHTYHTYFHKGKWVLKKTYWFSMSVDGEPTPTPQVEEDITQVCWKSNFSDVLRQTYPSIVEVLVSGNYLSTSTTNLD
jgi:ADP-ribose pyrophosphatase YjhB (NUDIX family)